MLRVKAKDIYVTILSILIGLVLLNGLLVSILKFLGIVLPVSIISILILISAPLSLYRLFKFYNKGKTIRIFSLMIVLFLIFIFSKLIWGSNELSAYTVSMTIIFISSVLASFLLIGVNESDSLKILNVIQICGYILLMVSWSQYFLYDVLPSVFVELPRIDSSLIKKDYTREIEDTIIFRPNGLFANPIVFGSLLLFFYSVELYCWFETRIFFYLVTAFLFFLMICFLFSRANITAAVLIFTIILYQRVSFKKFIRNSIITIIISISFLGYMYGNNIVIGFMIDRFLGNDIYSVTSTDEHLADYKAAINVIEENPITGISFGQNTIDSIITDGAWFIYLLDFGIPLFCFYFGIWLFCLYIMSLLQQTKNYQSLIFPYFIAITITGFLNSFLSEKKAFFFIWLVVGLMLNLFVLQKGKSRKK